ncbi:mitochondrial biogenesis AIM24-domain-containing protein [Xylariaceae sp. FL0804]|nr:mitochondrial biogenesis AIM24-domain-containing protein [Xylariaceae sp. FL0804]
MEAPVPRLFTPLGASSGPTSILPIDAMRGVASSLARRGRATRLRPGFGYGSYVCRQCRAIQISSSPTTESPAPRLGGDPFGTLTDARDVADAQFEILGAPYSLLSVSLSASQRLYTRRGTLVAVSGKVQNAQSTLSLLSPFTRAVTGIPFLYQRITSTTPLTALISAKSPTATFQILRLDGTTDWMVSQRKALLAWTGHTLAVTPRLQYRLPVAHWGASELTGRGLAALSAPGHVLQLTLSDGEEFVAHPANVVAYTVTKNPPLPFRLKSSSIRLQVPSVTAWLETTKFFQNMRQTQWYKLAARALFALRTTARRTMWGDRLFLQFRGPMTVLLSSRASHVSDVLTNAQVNEIADAPPGAVPAAVELKSKPETTQTPSETTDTATDRAAVKVHVASVGADGKVRFSDAQNPKDSEKKE